MAEERQSVVPKGYPSPQVDVDAARDVNPDVRAPQQSQAAQAPTEEIRDAHFVEVGNQEEKGKSLIDKFLDYRRSNIEELPSAKAEIKAIAIEAMNDIRQTMNEFFFGKGEHAPEMGTPLHPTPQNVDRNMNNNHGYDPGEFARNAGNNSRGKGMSR